MVAVIYPNQTEAFKFGNETFRSLYDDRLTKKDLEKARLELGETEEGKTVTLLKLKEKLTRDKDFDYCMDDAYLLRFLRYRKYDVKKAYSTVQMFYEYKKERADLFDVPPNLEYFLRRDIVKTLPYRDENGCTIFWFDTSNWKLDEMSLHDVLLMTHALSDVITMNPSLQINGLVGLWDFEGLTASHLARYASPSVVRTILRSMQSTYPWRIKRLIVVNCNRIIRGLYNGIRYLISKKVADRAVLLGSDFSELHQYLNPRILPKKFGGCIETSECSIVQHVSNNLPYIKYERSFGPNKDY